MHFLDQVRELDSTTQPVLRTGPRWSLISSSEPASPACDMGRRTVTIPPIVKVRRRMLADNQVRSRARHRRVAKHELGCDEEARLNHPRHLPRWLRTTSSGSSKRQQPHRHRMTAITLLQHSDLLE